MGAQINFCALFNFKWKFDYEKIFNCFYGASAFKRVFAIEKKAEWGNCDDGACVTISFSYDSLSSKNYDVSFINDFSLALFKSDMNEKFPGFTELFEKVSEELISEYRDFINDMPDYKVPWDYREKFKVVEINLPYVATQFDFYSFTGGAHGNLTTEFYNFNVENKTILEYNKLFTGQEKSALEKIAEKILRKKYKIKENEKLTEAGFWFGKNKGFTLNGNFLILRDGLKFLFNQYEIAPYSMGQIEIFIPKDKLPEKVREKLYAN